MINNIDHILLLLYYNNNIIIINKNILHCNSKIHNVPDEEINS